MARSQYSEIRKSLRTLFSSQWLRKTAKECGFVKRERKLEIATFFWAIILSFATGKQRSLATIRRGYLARSRKMLAPSSFHERFNPRLKLFMKAALVRAMESASVQAESLPGRLEAFKDLVLADASVVRLHRFLAKHFPACRTNHTQAAAKLHVVLSVTGNGPNTVKVTKERANDGRIMRIGKWIKGRLLLFDLGFYRFVLFSNIDRAKGFFITRLKRNANPLITAINQAHRGNAIDMVGMHLQTVLPRLRRQTLDCQIEVTFQRRGYLGIGRRDRCTFRLVGVWNPETRGYHLYVTNIPSHMLSAQEVAKIYRARWQVEILFKELKLHYRLDQLPVQNPDVIEALIYAALITLLVSRILLKRIRDLLPKNRENRLKTLRWASVFAAYSEKILDYIMGRGTCSSTKSLIKSLKLEAVDPNANRSSLIQSVACSKV